MSLTKQVEKTHYEFRQYVTEGRWASIWHQLKEVSERTPSCVLEIGPGPGVFKCVANLFRMRVETLDLDPELRPDHVGSATELPFADRSYDVVCAFQALEHLPYQLALQAFREMTRVSRKAIIISLPDAKPVWRYQFHLPKLGAFDVLLPRPFTPTLPHTFDGEHYWEINKLGYELKKILADFGSISRLEKTYRVRSNPYHRFFVFARRDV